MLRTEQFHRCNRYTCGYQHYTRRRPGFLRRIFAAIFGGR